MLPFCRMACVALVCIGWPLTSIAAADKPEIAQVPVAQPGLQPVIQPGAQPVAQPGVTPPRVLRDPTDSPVLASSTGSVTPIMIKATLRGVVCRRGLPGFALIETAGGLIRVKADSIFFAGPSVQVSVVAITPGEVVIQPLDGGNPLVLR